jgi:hypothetical protein
MKRLIIFGLFISIFAHAQTDDEVKKLRDKWILDKQKNDEWKASLTTKLGEDEAKYKLSALKMEKLDDLIKNKKAYIAKAIQQADEALKDLSAAERVVSRKGAFFRCIRNELQRISTVNVQSCKTNHDGNFNEREEKLIKEWEATVTLSPGQLNAKKYEVQKELTFIQGQIDYGRKFITSAEKIDINIQNTEKEIKNLENDRKLIEANSKFVNCDSNTPVISLEEKVPYPDAKFQGPFFGVPRDNQDGLGTCYANTAKNLLVGASGGKDVASFLDLALVYKGDRGVASSGLDAGLSCETLDKMKEVGFCPQEFAPFERGEKNIYTDGLMGNTTGNIFDQSRIIKQLRNFFDGQEQFIKGNKEVSDQILAQAEVIIHNIKSRPNVIIPLPVARHQIPTEWKMLELTYLKSSKTTAYSQQDMLGDYKKAYRNFYSHYIRAVMEGKNRDEIFDVFKEQMKSFIDKYEIADEMPAWKKIFLIDTESDWNNPNLKKEIAKSVSFMKTMSGKHHATDEDFLKQCDESKGDIVSFLQSLQPLVKYMDEQKLDTKNLFDDKGRFRSAGDLIQLAIAPSCLKKENRKMPSSEFLCNSGYGIINNIRSSGKGVDEQKKMLRERVVVSLVQGYAMGNTFGLSNTKHINTLVGMRFNPTSKQCEYQIRESQTGTSFWQSEESIFNKIEALTEVRRK